MLVVGGQRLQVERVHDKDFAARLQDAAYLLYCGSLVGRVAEAFGEEDAVERCVTEGRPREVLLGRVYVAYIGGLLVFAGNLKLAAAEANGEDLGVGMLLGDGKGNRTCAAARVEDRVTALHLALRDDEPGHLLDRFSVPAKLKREADHVSMKAFHVVQPEMGRGDAWPPRVGCPEGELMQGCGVIIVIPNGLENRLLSGGHGVARL